MANKRIATVLNATLSCDHRVIDGAVGAQFLATLSEVIGRCKAQHRTSSNRGFSGLRDAASHAVVEAAPLAPRTRRISATSTA